MRIAGGSARGRRLQVPAGLTVRPTSDRIRQSLFNILGHAPALRSAAGPAPMGRSVLDAFAGSGALGLEALSRGAIDATFLEIAEAARNALGTNIRSVAPAEAEVLVMRRDACAPGPAPRPHDLVFLDPPYGRDLVATALAALDTNGWIGGDAILIVECADKDQLALPPDWTAVDRRRYGRTAIHIATRS